VEIAELRTTKSKCSILEANHFRASNHTRVSCILIAPRLSPLLPSIPITWFWRQPREAIIMLISLRARRKRDCLGMGLPKYIVESWDLLGRRTEHPLMRHMNWLEEPRTQGLISACFSPSFGRSFGISNEELCTDFRTLAGMELAGFFLDR
jgi:hypothetical protein